MSYVVKDADANILYDAAPVFYMPQDKLAAFAVKPYEGSDLPNKSDKSYNSKCTFLN